MQIVSVLDGMDEEEDVQQSDDDDDEEEEEDDDDEEDDEDDAEKLDSDEQSMFKMLISDNAAGAIIGKSGKTISELQTQSNARIKVSQTADFYPGTNERTILLTGPIHTVLEAQELIWDKIAQFSKPRVTNRPAPPPTDDSPAPIMGKVLIPNEAGGLIIGRAGATIKAIQEQSGARVQINPKEEMDSKISKERVLTISGTEEACAKCTELIIIKLQEDANVGYQNKSTSYGRSFGMHNDGMQHQQHQHQQQVAPAMRMSLPMGAETTSATSTITINVPDTIIGYVLGKRGAVIAEIQRLSGAKVVVSPRKPREDGDDSHPSSVSTGDVLIRIVTITGSPTAAQMAQFLITQKLQQANAGDGAPDQRRR